MNQIITGKKNQAIIEVKKDFPDQISFWLEAYFRFEVNTSQASQKIQKRDLKLFLDFMLEAEGRDDRTLWTPRLSRAFKDYLRSKLTKKEKRRWGDRTINRILAHLKTFSKWVHKFRPFPLGDPTAKLKLIPTGSSLEIERAITKGERRRILDAADTLLVTGGRSRDRRRNRKGRGEPNQRPRHKSYRAYRNRALIYTLIETGMRRQAITQINLDDVDFKKQSIAVEEKGGVKHRYQISKEGLSALQDYIGQERAGDFNRWKIPALFLTASTAQKGNGRLSSWMVNNIWNKTCEMASVSGKTPHSARHAMGRHIIEKTGNVAAVQRQLGHKNATYSLQYARITRDELNDVLDER